MTDIGWEFWGLKFSWFFIVLVSAVLFVTTWMKAHTGSNVYRLDSMAGDEGDD